MGHIMKERDKVLRLEYFKFFPQQDSYEQNYVRETGEESI